jgi:hypothetical protein
MQSFYPPQFEREMGCTVQEWLRWLPSAIGAHPYALTGCAAQVRLLQASLHLTWQVDTPLRIALLRLPRLQVTFAFSGLDAAQRHAFMTRFDLHMQRGGG